MKYNISDSHFVIAGEESQYHVRRTKIPAQKKKLVKRIVTAKRSGVTGVFSDVKNTYMKSLPVSI